MRAPDTADKETVPQGKRRFAWRLPEILEDTDNGLSDEMRALPAETLAEWEGLAARIVAGRRMLAARDRRLVIEALAAQRARIDWALLSSGERFRPQPQAAQAAAWRPVRYCKRRVSDFVCNSH